VKQRDKVARPNIDAFEAMIMCEDCEKGVFVSFDYSSDALSMSVLVVVDNRVALNAVDLPDEKAVHMKITPPNNEVFGFELFRAWHIRCHGRDSV
jgi:hypothetical protein